ncbi:MAG: hypothetical protein L7F78_05555 [Syntrophales bacterium LBB04]|nr:hypothetical protein [Syntrophales bacterium LBB04]
MVKFLRAMGFKKLSNGVMRLLTDQLNAHIQKVAQAKEIPLHWWPSMGGGKDGAKQSFVQEKYARHDAGTGDSLYCILTDKEPVRTFACRELTSQNGKNTMINHSMWLLKRGSPGCGWKYAPTTSSKTL